MKQLFTLFTFAFLLSFSGKGQVVTATLYPTEDAYSNSGAATTNYGTSGNLEVSKTATSVYRSFLKFDLSGIPANAVIAVALLKLTPDGTENITTTNSTQLFADLVNTSWSESTLNFNSNLYNNGGTPSMIFSNLISGKRVFDVRAQLQGIVDGCYYSEGWRIKRSNENTNALTKYFSREDATVSNRPQLEISYYIRPYVSAANIVHTSTLLSTDGSISPTVVNGSATTMNYRWYNSGGTQVGTSQNLTGVGKGWYGMKCYGSIVGDTTYHAFVVGTVGEDVSFTFYPGPNYVDDSRIMDHTTGSGNSISRSEQSIAGAATFFGAARFLTNSVWGSERTLIRYRLWIDPVCTVDRADLMLYGVNHILTDSSNASEMNLLTSQWTENGVAHINRPTHTTVGKINMPSLPTGNTNDTIDISGFYNIWKNNNLQNYGMLFQLQSYPPAAAARMAFGTGDAAVLSTRPKIEFTISVPADLSANGTLGVTYDATNSYADATLTLSPPSGAVSPYHYLISEDPISDFDDIYQTLRDSIFGGTLDSTGFYGTGETATSFDFPGLTPGQYHVTVFDKLGVRIYEDVLSINPINYEEQTNISFSNDIFTTSAANGRAIVSSYMTEETENAKVIFNVVDLPSGQTNFGLQNTSSALTSASDILHGFQVQSGGAKLIVNGVLGSTTYPVTATDELILVKNGANLEFHIAGTMVSSYALPTNFVYKTGVLAAANATKIKFKLIHFISFNWVVNRFNPIKLGSCFGSYGQISGRFESIILSTKTPTGYGAVLINNTTSTSQTADAGLPVNQYSFSNLTPGNYTLTLTFYWQDNVTLAVSPTPVIYTYNLVVGSEISWQNKVAAIEVPATQSLVGTTALSFTDYGHATSINELVLPPSGDVFVDFGIKVPSGPGNSMLAFMGFYNSDIVTLTGTPPVNFTGYGFVKFQFGFATSYTLLRFQSGASTTIGTFLPSDKYRLVYNPTSKIGSLYKYGGNLVLGSTAISTVDYTPTVPINVNRILAFVSGVDKGFTWLSTNLPCPANFIYAKLERQLKGVKYATHLNKVYFFYDEEYASLANLTYNVYDKNNIVVLNTVAQVPATPAGVTINREYGDNRYSLNVSSLAVGSYVLEVINEKGEKSYLRFIK